MASKKLTTKFAPAERSPAGEVKRQSRIFAGKELLDRLPDAVPCAVVVVNRHRQIVFTNERFMDLVPPEQRKAGVLGRRPGEVLDCIHASEEEGGCGTAESCRLCGAVLAVLASQADRADVRECRLLRSKDSEALDLRLWATPVRVDGEQFSIVAALDISDEKRRQALEYIFLHDIYNVAYGLSWYTDFLRKGRPDQVEDYVNTIHLLCREMIEEIDAQRILVRAERGELALNPEQFGSLRLLQDTVELYSRHPACQERRVRVDPQAVDAGVVSDRTLLSRVLCNMLKNALEACRPGETVTAGCRAADGKIKFWVHNPGFMPREVQLQVFQRSFSTKGPGRGLGTYSIRLLTERYLKGTVSFTSTADEGTIFRVRCPLALET